MVDANKAISMAASESAQAKLKISHLKKELQESLPKAKAAEKQNSSLVTDVKANKKIVEMLEVQFWLSQTCVNAVIFITIQITGRVRIAVL